MIPVMQKDEGGHSNYAIVACLTECLKDNVQ